MGAEDEGVVEEFVIPDGDNFSTNMLTWVIGDVLQGSPWFFAAEWFYRLEAHGWLTNVRRAVPGEHLEHRGAGRIAKGNEVVVELTEKARSWYRAWQVAEKLRGNGD